MLKDSVRTKAPKATKATNMTFPGWPQYSDQEITAVAEVLRSGEVNNWTGTQVEEFEKKLARFVGHKYAIALTNGTAALDLALIALGIGEGDEVIVTPRSFIASVACVVKCGAVPVFADVDEVSQNITAETIAQVVTQKTKAIIVVHLAGWPCDMSSILELADTHGLRVLEDCAQAHGATLDGKSVGSFGEVSCWSFCQDKIVTTGGEGGAIVCNSPEIHDTIWSLKEHGKSFRKINEKSTTQGYRWVHDSIGGNYRMTSMQSVIGKMQLHNIEKTVEIRNRNAQRLYENIDLMSGASYGVVSAGVRHAYYLAYVFIEIDKLKNGWTRDRILAELLSENVPASVGSCPELYLEKAFAPILGNRQIQLPVARKLGMNTIAFKVHPTLEEQHMQQIADIFSKILAKAIR